MRPSLATFALVLLALEPLPLIAYAVTAGRHECLDHVCMCARRCPPARAMAEHCQRSSSETRQIRGACNHYQAEALASLAVGELPPGPAPVTVRHLVGDVFFALRPLSSGHTRIDPRPPRSL
jgi:hypothetical protein